MMMPRRVAVMVRLVPLEARKTSQPGRRATWEAVSFRLDATPG